MKLQRKNSIQLFRSVKSKGSKYLGLPNNYPDADEALHGSAGAICL